MKEKFKGDSPRNARIKIDYSKKKPIVSFSYPKDADENNMGVFVMVFIFWLPFALLIMLFFAYIKINEDKNSEDAAANYNLSNYSSFKEFFENENLLNKTYEKMLREENETLWDIFREDIFNLDNIFFTLILLFPIIIYFLFKKPLQNFYPVWNGLIAHKKRRIFKPKDILYNEVDGYYCELPIFHNIILNYEAKKDFSKYLKFFEIREHKFEIIRRKKDKHNETLWYAKFYFSDKPMKGEIKITYK